MEESIRKAGEIEIVHLHFHSMYSLRDSIIKPDELIERLKEIGQDTVAVTDHGECLGSVTIYKKLKAAGIKYIHGVEFYICDDTSVKDKNNRYYHLVALCKNEVGRRNLNTLISMSEHPDRKYYKPRIDFDLLSQYSEGLIIMSACLAGEVPKAIMNEDIKLAEEIVAKYKERFGEDYYIEVQSHRERDQIYVNKELVKIASKLGVECVVTCDAHHVREGDRKYQAKYAFGGAYKEDGESYIDCFVQDESEVKTRLDYLDVALVERMISNTHVIADKCDVELPLSAPIMPKVNTPPEFQNNKEWLEALCIRGFENKLNIDYKTQSICDPARFFVRVVYNDKGLPSQEEWQFSKEEIEEYVQRYEYELDSLDRMGFIDYILLVYSYVDVGERRGPGRGSGGGSLINFLTGITDIDPIEHKLFFERFIDVGSIAKLEAGEITAKELKVPDIDVDFSYESCVKVLQFLHDTYGEDKVASIGRFGVNKTKGTIRDMAKALDIDLETADKIAKSFAEFELEEIDAMISGKIETLESAQEAIGCVKQYAELFEYVRKLIYLPKSFGLHPCGRVISTRELDYFLPSSYDSKGVRFLQGDMHDVEDVGLVKIDLLALRTLDQEFDTLDMSNEDVSFIDTKQDYKDPKVLDVFRSGDTCGIFQFSSPGMKQTLKKMNVSSIDDISAANALFRPGAMAYIDEYCACKNSNKEITYLHPDLEPILKNTYGVIVFQEQLIEIGRMAGVRNPDEIRKGTAKKKPEILARVKPELEEKLKARGWTQEQFDKLWVNILEFGRYSFNKCVSGKTKLYNNKFDVKHLFDIFEASYSPGITVSMSSEFKPVKNKIVGIYYSGKRELFRITTAKGTYIDCTDNHKFPTPTGEKLTSELKVGDYLHYFKGGKISRTKIKSIESIGIDDTYDVEMAGPHHNFILDNGIVTSNSHSSAYGIIAYMTAKQKVYYPAEFYAGLCNSFFGHSEYVKESAKEIAVDLEKHGVKISPFSFKKDHRRCWVDENKNIVYGLPLVRDLNTAVAEILYQNKGYDGDYFWKLAVQLKNSGMGNAKMQVLIKLGCFNELCSIRVALNLHEILILFKHLEAKSVGKSKLEHYPELYSIVEKHSVGINKNGSESASFKSIDFETVLNEYENLIKNMDIPDIPYRAQADFQKEYLGFVALSTGKEEDRSALYVKEVFPVRTKKGKLFAYNILTHSIGSGKSSTFSLYSYLYKRNPIKPGDIIRCLSWNRRGKYYVLNKYSIL